MKTILILRHAKSDWDANYVGDHERPLSTRGQKFSSRMGRYIANVGPLPDLIICSTALRTRETLERVMHAGDFPPVDVRFDPILYMATYDQMMSCIAAVPDEMDTVMMVGHEPTTSLFAGQLIGSASIRFPTAALARIDLNVEHWSSCRTGVGTLAWFVTPKIIKNRKRAAT